MKLDDLTLKDIALIYYGVAKLSSDKCLGLHESLAPTLQKLTPTLRAEGLFEKDKRDTLSSAMAKAKDYYFNGELPILVGDEMVKFQGDTIRVHGYTIDKETVLKIAEKFKQ